MKRIFMFVGLWIMMSSMIRADVLLDNGIDEDGEDGSNNHTYHLNGLSISFKRSARVLDITFNSSCDDAEVIIYKDNIPVDEDYIGNVDAGTTETYSVGGCEKGKVSVSVIKDGREFRIDNLSKAE